MSRPLEGHVALVTGATSGIGRGVAELLCAQGAKVVLNSVQSKDEGEALARQLQPNAVYIQADVSQADQATRLVAESVEQLGRIDIVINNAGAGVGAIRHRDLESVTEEMWDSVFRVNVLGPWHIVRAALPALRASGRGVVVNVTSLAGVRPQGSSIPYAVSKAAANHLTLLLANALGPEVRVNAVAPGLTDTPWTAGWDDIKESYAARTPLKQVGSVVAVAEACVALVQLRHVTGEVLVVDGGHHLRR
jgi:ketoreductase RED2